jgi:hyperosmotically inducible periplasmic protein
MKTMPRTFLVSLFPLLPLTAWGQTEPSPEQVAASAERAQRVTAESWRASQVIGTDVKNYADENLGKVEDLVVDMKAGEILAVVISSGGFLGIAGTHSHVPLATLRFDVEADAFMANLTKEELRSSNNFDRSSWPNYNDPAVTDRLRTERGRTTGDVRAPDHAPVGGRVIDRDRDSVTERTTDRTTSRTDRDWDRTTGRTTTDRDMDRTTGRTTTDRDMDRTTGRTTTDRDMDRTTGRTTTDRDIDRTTGRTTTDRDMDRTTGRTTTDRDMDRTTDRYTDRTTTDRTTTGRILDRDLDRTTDRDMDRSTDRDRAADNTRRNREEVHGVLPTDQGSNESDRELTRQIRSGIMDTDLSFNAKNVKIITRDGQVTLKGVVKNHDEHAAVLRIARSYANAANITDELRTDEE